MSAALLPASPYGSLLGDAARWHLRKVRQREEPDLLVTDEPDLRGLGWDHHLSTCSRGGVGGTIFWALEAVRVGWAEQDA